MKNIKNTELILEIAKGLKSCNGFCHTTKKHLHGIRQTDIKILDEETSKKLNREIGNYVSFAFNDILFFDVEAKEILCEKLKNSIKNLVKINRIDAKRVLVWSVNGCRYWVIYMQNIPSEQPKCYTIGSQKLKSSPIFGYSLHRFTDEMIASAVG